MAALRKTIAVAAVQWVHEASCAEALTYVRLEWSKKRAEEAQLIFDDEMESHGLIVFTQCNN